MKKLITLLSIIILTGCTQIKTGKITCEQKDIVLQDKNTIIIDVRTKEEYKEYHMKDAINIPYEKIVETLDQQKTDKETPIIVYCKSGTRSNKAFTSLKESGYKNIYDLGALSKCNA